MRVLAIRCCDDRAEFTCRSKAEFDYLLERIVKLVSAYRKKKSKKK